MALVLVRPGEAAPERFERSLYVACVNGASWEADALSQLQDAGITSATVFIGDDAPENAVWRDAAVKISDAIGPKPPKKWLVLLTTKISKVSGSIPKLAQTSGLTT